MDNLDHCAMLAREAGISYGKWKALQPVVKVEKVVPVLPDGWKSCEWCGKPFKSIKGKRFCEAGCRTEAARAKDKKR